jgi:HSP90 family molecular chaperone
MSERDGTISNDKVFLPSFGPEFLEDHARRIVRDPKIAIVELVANCWDAGADRVEVVWPEESVPDPIEICDNGTGMTYDQFVTRWRQLNYNRSESQGEDVVFPPDNRSSHRKAFGRNGKGRHSVFCFADQYLVETWRDGETNIFEVKRTDSMVKAPYSIAHIERAEKQGHGTIISTTLVRNHLPVAAVRDLIGSKFVTDPAFEVF